MIKFKLFNNFNKKKIALIVLLILALLFILGNYNREVIKSNIDEVVSSPSIRLQLINIAKVAIPLKNLVLMRNVDDKIDLLKSSGSCVFCDLTQANFKESDLKDVDFRYANLSGANLSNSNLSGANLSNSNLSGANLIGADLRGSELNRATLMYSNLSEAILDGVDLRNIDLTGVNLSGANLIGVGQAVLGGYNLRNINLSEVNLSGVDLRNIDLTRSNLSGVDLRNKDLTGTTLTYSNLSGANLDGVDLRNKDLTGVNLSGVDLRNIDLTGAILKDAKKIEIRLKDPSKSNWPDLNVTRYLLNEDIQYLATKDGRLFELQNNKTRLVLDLKKDAQYPFVDDSYDRGFLGVASKNNLVYVSYTARDINGLSSLVVDEYSMNFNKVRNIIKIDGNMDVLNGGALLFDNLGELYLSVGVGHLLDPENNAQNLNSLKGKILRLDVSKLITEAEVVAYGVRSPWGVSIDSKNRMFIAQCGGQSIEAVYLFDLYSEIAPNLGFPVFEGSSKLRIDSLIFNDIHNPIFETSTRPGCLTGGVYLDDLELFLFTDFYGTIRLLKEKENGDWYLLHEFKQDKFIWGLGLDERTKKILVAPDNLELEILVDQVNLN
ncbi:pentapeptide repeat-containing protein [Candidatus Pseudothioglobus singularis]|nr:pentapeptide repeat-containing protein [Candidatus Pseudothioglobus singularis]